MAETRDRQHIAQEPASATVARIEASQVSALIQEATDLIHARSAPVSALLAFHERKAALFEALAAEEPWNTDRREVATSARAQLEHLRVMAMRGCR